VIADDRREHLGWRSGVCPNNTPLDFDIFDDRSNIITDLTSVQRLVSNCRSVRYSDPCKVGNRSTSVVTMDRSAVFPDIASHAQ
jgi:hypothetical protein